MGRLIIEVWDSETRTYSQKNLDIYSVAITDDMNKLIMCPNCRKEFPFGKGYTSNKYFFKGGIFAMSVCPSCKKKEWEDVINEAYK